MTKNRPPTSAHALAMGTFIVMLSINTVSGYTMQIKMGPTDELTMEEDHCFTLPEDFMVVKEEVEGNTCVQLTLFTAQDCGSTGDLTTDSMNARRQRRRS